LKTLMFFELAMAKELDAGYLYLLSNVIAAINIS
jgi:hypothetical protein